MRTAILTCILGDFDHPVDPAPQKLVPYEFHRFTDKDFPPITGLTPRLQYRIPKTHGFEMSPGFDAYMWLDGSLSLQREDCLRWYLDQLGDGDIGVFKHPDRETAKQEVEYIEGKLKDNHPYIASRYQNGLHREQLDKMLAMGYRDKSLFHTGAFIYRNTPRVREALRDWWYEGSRFFTCDQVVFPYILWKHKLDVKILDEPIYKSGYISLVSHHK